MTQSTLQTRPAYVSALEAAYGAPSQAGFGSAVFYEAAIATADLEQAALDRYRYFVGELWERFGAAAWLSTWQLLYTRSDQPRDIASELLSITDRDAQQLAPLIVDNGSSAASSRQALAAAFDSETVALLQVYKIGDGAALSGLLIAGGRDSCETIFLVLLLV
jgi:hypothetical protein